MVDFAAEGVIRMLGIKTRGHTFSGHRILDGKADKDTAQSGV